MEYEFDQEKDPAKYLDTAFDEKDEMFNNDSGDDEVNHSGD